MPQQLPSFSWISLIDIFIVAFVLYKLIMLIRGTRAVQLIKGLVVLLIATTLSDWLGFYTINWVLERTINVLLVALPIVFLPELRRALEQLGRGKFFAKPMVYIAEEDMTRLINELVRSVQVLVKNKIGALIIIERETGLNEYVETGTKIDGVISAEFLVNLFIPKSPLHDGAVIIRGDRVIAASCYLPLSEDPNISKELGTRHRAGIGITELSDALSIIISEETANVSMAQEGNLTRYLDETTLKEMLINLLQPKSVSSFPFNWRS